MFPDPTSGATRWRTLVLAAIVFWTFIGSECMFFGSLIATYLVYKGKSLEGPMPHEILNIPLTSFSAFDLLMSSLTMVLAVSSAARRDDRRTTLWLTITALLGCTFVGGQVYEFTSFYREGVGFTSSLYSSSFYTLTGFHVVHVTVGPPATGFGTYQFYQDASYSGPALPLYSGSPDFDVAIERGRGANMYVYFVWKGETRVISPALPGNLVPQVKLKAKEMRVKWLPEGPLANLQPNI